MQIAQYLGHVVYIAMETAYNDTCRAGMSPTITILLHNSY